ncbi:Scr1 family TA system antitoxin-like transcriptional regulator [Actinocorallia sp. B10E7]|uniref:Scr1 family TA system antitoxin-like transcriptional regulator n=1 Tax=Actinocorallia sp. B10E7 TaxID=3153558 RepID=UPI00325E01B1
MSHRSAQEVVAAFIADLKEAWAVAATSYAAVERLAEETRSGPGRPLGSRMTLLPAATVNDLLTKPRHRLPRWEMTASLLVVLRKVIADRGEDPDRIGTLTGWKARHEAAHRAVDEIRLRNRRSGVSLASGEPAPEDLARRRAEIEDAQRATLLAMAGNGERKWWHPYRDVVPAGSRDYLTLERSSHRLQIYEPGAVPDLLWPEERIHRLVRRRHPGAPESLVASTVGLQLSRRHVLHRDEPTRLWVLLDETAVQPFADRDLWRAQLEHLLALASLRNVSLQIRASGAHTSPIGDEVRLLRFREAALPDVVCLRQGEELFCPAQSELVHHYVALLKGQFFSAATPENSVKILKNLLKRN